MVRSDPTSSQEFSPRGQKCPSQETGGLTRGSEVPQQETGGFTHGSEVPQQAAQRQVSPRGRFWGLVGRCWVCQFWVMLGFLGLVWSGWFWSGLGLSVLVWVWFGWFWVGFGLVRLYVKVLWDV